MHETRTAADPSAGREPAPGHFLPPLVAGRIFRTARHQEQRRARIAAALTAKRYREPAPARPAPSRLTWTPELDAALLDLRARGFGILACADEIGCDPSIVRLRLHELGQPMLRPWARLRAERGGGVHNIAVSNGAA